MYLIIVVKKKKKHRAYPVKKCFKTLARSAGRHSRKSTVNIVMNDRKLVAVKMGKFVKKELQATCSNKAESKCKDKSLDALTSFSWKETLIDLEICVYPPVA